MVLKKKVSQTFSKLSNAVKGFNGFYHFIFVLNAQKSNNNILIIDEPGVHLHANAQKEVLKVIENEIVKDAQVIFSTHCPYLINPQRLDRIRVLLKGRETGSVISDDIHGLTGEESLAPVLTATGAGQSNFAPLMGKKNVIVGSVHDFYFWKALRAYFANLNGIGDLNLLPAPDVNSAEQLISMLVGYDEDFQVLLNHNNEGWKFGQQLKEKFGISDEKLTFVSEKLGYFTEDLFTFEDFKDHVVCEDSIEEQATLNSTYLRNNNMNKIFLARKLYERTKAAQELPVFSTATIASFRETFVKLIDSFKGGSIEEGEENNIQEELKKDKKASKGGVKRSSLFAFLRNK